jgi:hypothetical protein
MRGFVNDAVLAVEDDEICATPDRKFSDRRNGNRLNDPEHRIARPQAINGCSLEAALATRLIELHGRGPGKTIEREAAIGSLLGFAIETRRAKTWANAPKTR